MASKEDVVPWDFIRGALMGGSIHICQRNGGEKVEDKESVMMRCKTWKPKVADKFPYTHTDTCRATHRGKIITSRRDPGLPTHLLCMQYYRNISPFVWKKLVCAHES